MIEAVNLTKRFDEIVAVDHINATIKDGSVFGLIGTNGAGKSTFLRLASGVLKPDEGRITIDGREIFEDEASKRRFFYISDEQFFFSNATPEEMMGFYKKVYEDGVLKDTVKINTSTYSPRQQVTYIGTKKAETTTESTETTTKS